MNIIEQLVKSANDHHGRTLQPDQVREVVSYLAAMDNQIQVLNGRLDALTRIALLTVSRLGGKVVLQSFEFDEADGDGFSVHWDEEGDTIEVVLDSVAVSEVQLDDGAADGESVAGLAPVPEVSEAGAEAEASSDEEGSE